MEINPGELIDQIVLNDFFGEKKGDSSTKNWMLGAYKKFIDILSSKDFPCLFGKQAVKAQSLKILFVSESTHLSDWVNGVLSYTSFVKTTPIKERLYSPLVVFFEKNSFKNIETEHEFCWEQIQILHENDPKEWPEKVPADTNDTLWTFCFNEVELFFNISNPHHIFLKSRNLGEYITFIINPRNNFDFIASKSDPKGIKIRKKIRERVCLYNDGIIPTELGFFGDDGNYEWKQYQLHEPDEKTMKKCPLSIIRKAKSLFSKGII